MLDYKKKRGIIIISIGLLSLGLIFILKLKPNKVETILPNKVNKSINRTISLGGHKLSVEIADTPEKKEKGLSGRKSLAENSAMIFPYNPPERVVFWMPDMNFPIDIVYLNNNQVVEIYKQVPNFPADTPRDQLPRYPSRFPVNLVIELPAGWSDSHNLKIGDTVQY